jgi:hypothetical protein
MSSSRWNFGVPAIATCAIVMGACGGSGNGDPLDVPSVNDDASVEGGRGGTGLDFETGGDDGAVGCAPKTCAELGANCGPVADGCGGIIDSCGTCTAPESCGGGGTPSVCGGTAACVPQTCADLGASCGQQGDGCGNLIDCGTCPTGESCGGGGTPNVCGKGGADGGTCKPKTCAELGFDCGGAADGCGNLIDCGTCSGTDTCGGAGQPSVCGTPVSTCKPKTCADLGINCGPAGDGCGGTITSCGTCTAPQTCGGGGTASVCGYTPPPCDNLECKLPTCAAGKTTSISGTVFDPAGKVPLYNVVVYVPNAPVASFVSGASCDRCADALSGSPLVQTVTGTDGKFKLDGVPAGADIPVVIQSGKWRRQIKVTTTACVDNVVADKNLTRLPRNKSEGDIPRIALTTGGADPLECLLRKIGIDDAEFTNDSGNGRVHLYVGSGGTSKFANTAKGSFATARTLWDSKTKLNGYDVVLFACEGGQNLSNKTTAARQNVIDYTGIGGRVFASHWHNAWIESSPLASWKATANWNFADDLVSPVTALIDTSFPKGDALATWMVNVAGSTTKGRVSIRAAQHTVDTVVAPATRWIYAQNVKDEKQKDVANATLYYTFNTPIEKPAAEQCGRVVYSDIHVSSADKVNTDFPNGCTTTDLSPQEKALEFMLFDLTSRVCDDTKPPPPPVCVKKTCEEAGVSCGPAADGCGGLLACGTCVSPETCGGGGVAGKCGKPSCSPRTCAQMGVTCGLSGDGCGNTIDCGTCPQPDGGTCTPQPCGSRCGKQGDGCGNVIDCPACPDGGTACTPRTCTQQGAECGTTVDGCGKLLDCGSCTPPKTCGGSGIPNKCGGVQ